MRLATSQLKGLLVALVALALSAGVAFAGSSHGLATASTAAGKTVPVKVTQPAGGDEQASEPDGTDEATEDAPDTNQPSGEADNCSTDPTNLTADQLAQLTHGQIVCWAAHQPTPAGYANHGAWVSHWAKPSGSGGAAPNGHAANGLSHKGKGTGNKP